MINGTNNNYEISLQFSKPSSDNDSEEGKASSFVYSLECSSIFSGINTINSYVSKEINLSHCKAVIFSEDLAKSGLSKEVHSLINDVQLRPDSYLIISKCPSKDFIEYTEPDLESSVSQYYELIQKANEYIGYTDYMTIGKFYNILYSDSSDAYAILGGINYGNSDNSSTNKSNYEKDTSVKAGEIDFGDAPTTEISGLAIFKKDILVGELTAIETISHLMVTNGFKSTTLSIENPLISNSIIDLYIYKDKSPKKKVYFVNGAPYITIDCKFNARLLSVDDNSYINSEEFLNQVGKSASKYLKTNILQYLYKTSKIFNTDTAGLGRKAIGHFTTVSDWENYNWLNNYKNSFFKVNVDTNVRSGMILKEK